MPYAGAGARVTISSTSVVSLSSQALTSADGKVYQVSDSTYQGEPWHPTATVTVANTSATLSSTTYTLNRLNGSVIFSSSATRNLAVTATLLPTTNVAEAHAFDYTVAASNTPVSVFGDTYRNRMQTLLDVTGSFADFHDDLALARLQTSTSVPVAMTIMGTTAVLEVRAWAYLNADDVSASVDGVVDGSVSFEGKPDVDGRVVTFSTRGTSG